MQDLIRKFGNKKVTVIGDIMLDRYILGDVSGISPEAPVPILKQTGEKLSPGGAANVSLNLFSLGAETSLIGAIGKDSFGKLLRNEISKSGIECKSILEDKSKPTTVKTRLIASGQQIIRIDSEITDPVDEKTSSEIINAFKKHIKSFNPDAVIISDYNKGLLNENIIWSVAEICNKNGIFLAADPKGPDFYRYRGVNLITPNKKEAEIACGLELISEKAFDRAITNIRKKTGAECVLITRGSEGLSYKVKGKSSKSVKSSVKEVFDVTGAGDTFIAAFVLSYISAGSYDKAAVIANRAAGISVTKFGAAVISPDELLISENRNGSKLITAPELKEIISGYRNENRNIVFTNGCFDIIHSGHISLLRKSKDLGDILIVGINSDNSVRKIKGSSRPVNSEMDRSEILSSLEFVDHVVLFSGKTPLQLIKKIKPDLITKGADYKLNEVVGRDFVESYGGRVVLIPLVKNLSTTDILEKQNKLN